MTGFPLSFQLSAPKILMNGTPGRRIYHARGLRQGDPLSPMLFVLVIECFNAMLRKADECDLFSPLDRPRVKYRASLYADDMVVFLTPVPHDLVAIRELLNCFGHASGLATNYAKSHVYPIRCLDNHVSLVKDILRCQVADFPCPYLGVPLSIGRLPKAALQPLVDKIASRIPAWKGRLLNRSGHLTLAKSTLAAIPVHISMAITVAPWAIKTIETLIRGFLWAGSETVCDGKCAVSGLMFAAQPPWAGWGCQT